MRTVVAGIMTLLLSVRLWLRDVTVGGRTCGSVHDVWTGRWSPPYGAGDVTGECLDAAVWPARAAQASLVASVVLVVVGSLLVVRSAWRTTRVRPQLAAAGSLASGAAAVAFAAALYADPGPACPYVVLGMTDDARAGVSQCLVGGGGWGLGGSLQVAGAALVVTAAVSLYYLLLARSWHRTGRRQEGWATCATS